MLFLDTRAYYWGHVRPRNEILGRTNVRVLAGTLVAVVRSAQNNERACPFGARKDMSWLPRKVGAPFGISFDALLTSEGGIGAANLVLMCQRLGNRACADDYGEPVFRNSDFRREM